MRSPPQFVRLSPLALLAASLAAILAAYALTPTTYAASTSTPVGHSTTALVAVLPSFTATDSTTLCSDVASPHDPTLLSVVLGSQEVLATRSDASTRPATSGRFADARYLLEGQFPAWYAGHLRPQFGFQAAPPVGSMREVHVRSITVTGEWSLELKNVADAQQPIPHQRE